MTRPDVLSPGALNRALLARQMLLARKRVAVVDAVERLVGLQAQSVLPPYIALWSRLSRFDPASLSTALEERAVVRIALMRGTVHLVSARDALMLRPLVQPVLDRQLKGTYGRRLAGVPLTDVARHGRTLLDEQPRMLGAIGPLLQARWPQADADALANAVRALVALVQPPPRGLWRRSGAAVHATIDQWLGRAIDATPSIDEVVMRYLAAFGPASPLDAQAWSGLTRLAVVFERLRPRLRTFRSERGRELFDLPDAPRPRATAVAPVRYLGEYDNLLLAHDDRSRIVHDDDRKRVFTGNAMLPAVLIDGRVGAVWRLERAPRAIAIVVEAFVRLTRATMREIEEEGHRLLAMLSDDDEQTRDVRVVR